jgi:hypothetical protein
MQQKWNDESEIRIVRYVPSPDGTWALPDEFWFNLWWQMEADGIVEKLFSEGFIVTAEELISWLKGKGNLVTMTFVGEEPAVLGWVNGIKSNHGYVHYCVMKSFWGYTQYLGRKILGHYFDIKTHSTGEPYFKVLVGMTPDRNRLAVKIAEKVGFTIVGTIPNTIINVYTKKREGITISYLERDTYLRLVQNG